MSVRRSPLSGFPPIALDACVPSLYHFYAERDLAFDELLIGTWIDNKRRHTWQFSSGEKPCYRLVHTDADSRSSEFIVHMFRIDGMSCLDLWPTNYDASLNPLQALHVVPPHNAMLIRRLAPALEIAFLSYAAVRRHLEKLPTAVAHARPRNHEYVLTALPQDLQRFIVQQEKSARTSIFANTFELIRSDTPSAPRGSLGD